MRHVLIKLFVSRPESRPSQAEGAGEGSSEPPETPQPTGLIVYYLSSFSARGGRPMSKSVTVWQTGDS